MYIRFQGRVKNNRANKKDSNNKGNIRGIRLYYWYSRQIQYLSATT